MTACHRFLEQRMTRDERVPLSDDDPKMEHSWRCVPVPPTNDPNWRSSATVR
jgi:hypothetical protein